jgi:hypothetical protein
MNIIMLWNPVEQREWTQTSAMYSNFAFVKACTIISLQ